MQQPLSDTINRPEWSDRPDRTDRPEAATPRGAAPGNGSGAAPGGGAGGRVWTTIRPTPRAAGLFALAVPVALVIVTGFSQVWYTALYLPATVLAFILADLTMTLPSRRLQAAPRIPAQLYVGRSGAVSLELDADQARFGLIRPVPIRALLEYGGQDRDVAPPEAASGLLRDGSLALNLDVRPLRRGQVVIAACWLRWCGPLRLLEVRTRRPVGARIDVTPDVHGIHEEALRFFANDAVYGLKSQRLRGEGTEFDTLCDYAPGMDNRFIDWKRSARHRKLLCKEFRQERNHQIVLGFDTGHLMLEPIDGMPKLDHAIRAGLLLGWISLRNGDLIGGCGFDARFRSFIKPGRGMPYFTQFQRFAAGLAYETEETNFTLGLAELNTRLQRRALIVLFAEFVDTISAELLLESLHLLVRRHVVVFVTLRDPMPEGLRNAPPDDFAAVAEAVIADDFLRERAVVLERVARLGVHCLDVPAREVSTALLNRYLLIKQRGLL